MFKFEEAELKLIAFTAEDVITTSGKIDDSELEEDTFV